MAVPTNVVTIRARLRHGECEMECHDRLHEIMLCLDNDGHPERRLKALEKEPQADASPAEDEGPHVYSFYTKGTQEPLDARMKMAKYSVARAAARLDRAMRRKSDLDEDEDEDSKAMEVVRQVKELVLECS